LILDETDVNCRRFIDLEGLDVFQQCLEVCPSLVCMLHHYKGTRTKTVVPQT